MLPTILRRALVLAGILVAVSMLTPWPTPVRSVPAQVAPMGNGDNRAGDHPLVATPAAPPVFLLIPRLPLSAPVLTLPPGECPALDPPTTSEAYWVGCRAMPGTDSTGTVFIIGHSTSDGSGVFDALPALRAGDDIFVTTRAGVLGYRVTGLSRYGKHGEVQTAPQLRRKAPGRLLLVTCDADTGGTLTDQNLVVEAELVSARPLA